MIKWFKKWRRRRMTKSAIKKGLANQHALVADLLTDINENAKEIRSEHFLACFYLKQAKRYLENYARLIEAIDRKEWKSYYR